MPASASRLHANFNSEAVLVAFEASLVTILAAGNMHVRLCSGSKERSTVRVTRAELAEPRVRWKDPEFHHPDQASVQSTPLVINRECRRGRNTSNERGSTVMRVGREAIVSSAES